MSNVSILNVNHSYDDDDLKQKKLDYLAQDLQE